MKNCKTFISLILAILILSSCGIPNRSYLTGTYDGNSFMLKGKIDILSRHGSWMDCSQGVSFSPGYPFGDQLSFTLGFKGKDMYQGFKEQIGKNLLVNIKDRIDNFYISGYTNKDIEIDIGDAPEGDFFIIEKVELKKKRFRSNTFKELNKAVIIEGKMYLHFDEIIIDSDFKFVFGQCYKQTFKN